MYQAAVSILGSIGITLIYFYILNFPKFFKKVTGRNLVKPFSCSFCMSFWISLFFLMLKTDLIEAIFISSIVPFMYLNVEDHFTNKFELWHLKITNYSRSISNFTNATKSTLLFAIIARKYTRNLFTFTLPMSIQSIILVIGAVHAGRN